MNIYCPECEAANHEDAEVCSLCGHRLRAPKPSPPAKLTQGWNEIPSSSPQYESTVVKRVVDYMKGLEPSRRPNRTARKQCPKCKEWVDKGATKCAYCQSEIIPVWNAVAGFVVLIVIIGFCCGIPSWFVDGSSQNASPPRPTSTFQERKWYHGGTLHKRLMSDWYDASYSNRLATAADFVVAAMKSRGNTPSNVDDLKPKAFGLEICISEAGGGAVADNQEIAGIGAVCLILMERE